MTIHRFFVESIVLSKPEIKLTGEIAWQIAKVLRLKPHHVIHLFDGSGKEWKVVLTHIEPDHIRATITKEFENKNEPLQHISLYQSLLPRSKFEEVLEKGTEVGVSEFIPLETQRTLLKVHDVDVSKLNRWRRIIKEASEQSERGRVPRLAGAKTFQEAIIVATTKGLTIVAWEEEQQHVLNDIQITNNDRQISLFIGPEGGFTKEEIEFAKKKGAQTVSLGKRILRSETAGIIFPAVVLSISNNV